MTINKNKFSPDIQSEIEPNVLAILRLPRLHPAQQDSSRSLKSSLLFPSSSCTA